MSTELRQGSLYILLYIRNEPPQPNDFHWALYLHQHPDKGGTKYHIKTVGPGWMADHGPVAAIMKEFLLVGLFHIADVPLTWHDHLDRTFRSFDDNLNTLGNTCRVWLIAVLELLRRPVEGYTLLNADLSALQREICDWGNAHAASAAANEQPRPIGASKVCGL